MKRVLPWIDAAAVLVWGVFLYLFDPEGGRQFLPCPFHWLTHLYCPGCGAQRAMHDLLHGRIGEAFDHNVALVLSIPLLGVHWGIRRRWGRSPAHGNRVALAWGIALVVWGLVRNLPGLEVLAP